MQSNLFDGKTHFMDPETDWVLPWLRVGEWVERAVQPKDLDPLETPDLNYTCNTAGVPNQAYLVEDGWSVFGSMVAAIGDALGGKMTNEQLNHRDADANILEVEYRFKYKPGPRGWVGEL